MKVSLPSVYNLYSSVEIIISHRRYAVIRCHLTVVYRLSPMDKNRTSILVERLIMIKEKGSISMRTAAWIIHSIQPYFFKLAFGIWLLVKGTRIKESELQLTPNYSSFYNEAYTSRFAGHFLGN